MADVIAAVVAFFSNLLTIVQFVGTPFRNKTQRSRLRIRRSLSVLVRKNGVSVIEETVITQD